MAYVSHWVGMFLLTAASLFCYWWVLGKVVAAVWPDRNEQQRTVITAAVALVLLASDPVSQTLGFGQINYFLMALVIGDITRRTPSRWQGVPIAIAATFKLIPGIFLVYLLVTRRVRAAITGGVAFLATIAIGWIAMPGGSQSYWLDGVGTDPTHIGGSNNLTNGSLLGLFARPLGYETARPYWLALAIPTFVLGMWIAREVHRRLGDIAGITATAFTAMLVSPIAWTHHWTWFVVPALWVGRVAWERRDGRLGAAVAVWVAPFFLPPIRFVPFDRWTTATHSATESILGSGYVVWGFAGMVALGIWLLRTRPPSGAGHGDVADDEARQEVATG
jgi:alpha-1,2-mannosyltransferase